MALKKKNQSKGNYIKINNFSIITSICSKYHKHN